MVAAGVMAVALVIALASADVARVLIAKGSVQTAADAAALAAVQDLVLPSETPPATSAATYARANGATLVACTCELGTTEALVGVQVSVRLGFLGGTREVYASARAVVDVPLSP